METILYWGASLAMTVLYAYVIGTGIWLVFVAPGMYKRQRRTQARLDALELRVAALDASRPAL
jgi:hypothetical protein